MEEAAPVPKAAPRRSRHAGKVQAGRVLFGLLLLVLWDIWGQLEGADLVARPLPIAQRIWEIVADGSLFPDLGTTLFEALAGLVIGFIAGTGMAFLMLASKRLARALAPYIRMGMGIPKFALAPLLILWIGIGVGSKVAVSALIVFFIVYEAAGAGVRSVDQRLVVMARIVGARPSQVSREIVLHSILPFLFSGLKTCLPLALNAAVLGEFIASRRGLGSMINKARDGDDIVGVFVGVVLVTVLVVALDLGLTGLRTRSLSWQVVDGRTTL